MNEKELQKACKDRDELLVEAMQDIAQTTSYPPSIVSCLTNGPLLQMIVRQQTSRAGQAHPGHIIAVLRRIVPKHMEAFTQFRRLWGLDAEEGWLERHLEEYGKELGGLHQYLGEYN
jgi:hypothetical protein